MKTTIKLLAIALLLFLNSCKKDKENTPALQCKLATIDRGNGNKHFYAYDANGKITTMTREFDGDGSGKVSKFVYTLTYDASGLLASSSITLDGVADSKEKYTYTNGKISRTDFEYADGSKGYNAIKFDTKGNLIEFTYQGSGNTDEDIRQYFEYDANNIMIKRGFSDMTGSTKFFEVVTTKVVGSVKLAESLLLNNGLPYDLLTGFGYGSMAGNVGTEFQAYGLDENGVFSAIPGIIKITDIKTNAKGYLTEDTVIDLADNSLSKETFGLMDCQ